MLLKLQLVMIKNFVYECNNNNNNNWVKKEIHWELCKKPKFNHMNKWYMHNQ